MSASEITVQSSGLSGLEATYEAANADGNTFTNDGKTLIHVKNGGGSDITVTVDSPVQCNQGFTHDPTVVVTAGENRFIGPFPPSRFNSEGKGSVSYSGVTDVTVAVIKVA
ncbi:MAG: hypothetical protein HQM10_03890 [Candidatus Riflebacteria bacterium]|nr:hypothetical protein [Candidatus Riflebacteria bacterium]